MASRKPPMTPDKRHQLYVDLDLSDEEDERVPYPGLTRPLRPFVPSQGTSIQRSDRQNAEKRRMLMTQPPPPPPGRLPGHRPERVSSTAPAGARASTSASTSTQEASANLASLCAVPATATVTSATISAPTTLRIREQTVLLPARGPAPSPVPIGTLEAAQAPPMPLTGHQMPPPIRVELAPGLSVMVPHHAVHVGRRYRIRLPGERWFLRFDRRGRLSSRRRQEEPQ